MFLKNTAFAFVLLTSFQAAFSSSPFSAHGRSAFTPIKKTEVLTTCVSPTDSCLTAKTTSTAASGSSADSIGERPVISSKAIDSVRRHLGFPQSPEEVIRSARLTDRRLFELQEYLMKVKLYNKNR